MDLAKVVVGALLHLVFVLGIALGGWGVWSYDRHPDVDYTVPAPVRWVLPASWKHLHLVTLAGKLDDEAQALQKAQDAERRAEATLAQQNASIAALSQQSATEIHAASVAVAHAKPTADHYTAQAAKLEQDANPILEPSASDRLSQWEAADREVGEALR